MTEEIPATPGEAIIESVIRTGCLDVHFDEGGYTGAVLFVWNANAAEQLEAAIEDLGYKIVRK